MATSESSITDTPRASHLDIETISNTICNGQDQTANKSQRDVAGFRWFLVCVAIFSANLLYGLDTTIAADIQASVSETFDNVTQLGWLGVGFTLGSTVAILPLGKAYAIFNTKWVFISCLTMFAAGSALCGAAPSMNAIIVGRVWAGIGGAGMYLGTLNLVTFTTTQEEQPFYVGMTGFIYGSGCILGPIVGGSLADSPATWRWGFYLNLVVFGTLAPVYLLLLPSLPRQQDINFIQKIGKLDWLGTVLTAGLYSPFTVAFTFGDRLFPCEFLSDPQLVLLYVCMARGGTALFVAVYYIPLYFLFVHGDSGTQAAVRLLPFICFYVATILICGATMRRTGYHMVWYLISGFLMTCGGALMYTVDADTQTASIYGYTILLGLGMTTTQAGYAIGSLLVKEDRVPEVIQFLNISQGQSQLIGLTIASSIFQSTTASGLKKVLAGSGYSTTEIQAAIAGAKSTVLQTTTPSLRKQCLDVIIRGINDVWVLVIAAGALYTICSCFLTYQGTSLLSWTRRPRLTDVIEFA